MVGRTMGALADSSLRLPRLILVFVATLTCMRWQATCAKSQAFLLYKQIFVVTSATRQPRSVAAKASSNPLRLPKGAESPYDVIGLPKSADKSEVRKIFRKRVQTEHPDVNPDDPDAAERFQLLVGAYNTIMGDELLPDEMTYVRAKYTPKYNKALSKEMSATNGVFFALLPGIGSFLAGVIFVFSDFLPFDAQTKEVINLLKGQ